MSKPYLSTVMAISISNRESISKVPGSDSTKYYIYQKPKHRIKGSHFVTSPLQCYLQTEPTPNQSADCRHDGVVVSYCLTYNNIRLYL